METQIRDKVYWHDAFFEALQLELHEYLDALTFANEHPLSKEALIVDVLVIKKERDIKIEKNIGKIFKAINLFEFKSETDSLTVRDYNKVMGYAYLYASFAPAHASDITISFAVTVHPRDLLDYLENDCKFKISYSDDGICYVSGETFVVQILESKKLSPEKNLFLKNLRSNLDIEEARRTMDAYKELKEFERRNAYVDRIVKANPNVFEEVFEMSDAALRNMVIVALAEEKGLLKEHDMKNARKIARDLKEENVPIQVIVKSTKLSLQEVEAL